MAGNIGFYFDRFRVLVGGQDFAGKPGNIVSCEVSQDGGVSWVDGFSEDHMPSGVLRANTHTIFRITENLQYNNTPIDFSKLDFDTAAIDIQLIAPTSQYGSDVYAGGSIYLLKSVVWANDRFGAQYASNARRELDFMVVGGANFLPI